MHTKILQCPGTLVKLGAEVDVTDDIYSFSASPFIEHFVVSTFLQCILYLKMQYCLNSLY